MISWASEESCDCHLPIVRLAFDFLVNFLFMSRIFYETNCARLYGSNKMAFKLVQIRRVSLEVPRWITSISSTRRRLWDSPETPWSRIDKRDITCVRLAQIRYHISTIKVANAKPSIGAIFSTVPRKLRVRVWNIGSLFPFNGK